MQLKNPNKAKSKTKQNYIHNLLNSQVEHVFKNNEAKFLTDTSKKKVLTTQ